MSKIEHYTVIESCSLRATSEAVNYKISEGYIPLGGICANKDTYSQAMIKYRQEE